MAFTNEEKDSIRIVTWECIKSFKENNLSELCNLKHKEVNDLKDDIKSIDKKFWAVILLVISTLITVILK